MMATTEELLTAIRARDAAATAALVNASPALAGMRPASGPSPLLMAAYMGAADCVALLRPLLTPDLFESAALGDVDAARAALERTAESLEARSGDGWTALHLAGFFGHAAMARFLLDAGAPLEAISGGAEANRPLHAALAGAGNADLVSLLVERGADVRARAALDYTPLHIAASRGSEPFVDLLIGRGADAGARMTDGRTPADLAAERGFPALAARLQGLAGG